jgi:hydrogenase maturation factor
MSVPAQGRCVTCSDEAVEARVVATDGAEATVRIDGTDERVAIDLVPDAAPGDLLLCHAGIALERLEAPGEKALVTPCHEVSPAPVRMKAAAS